MAKNFYEDGHTIDFVAAADHQSGDLVALGDLMVVVLEDVKNGEPAVGASEGVWTLPKVAGAAVNQGTRLTLKDGVLGTDETGKPAGIAWADADSDATTVPLKLNA